MQVAGCGQTGGVAGQWDMKLLLIILILALSIFGQGCSVICSSAGAIIDYKTPDETEITGEKTRIPSSRTRVRIVSFAGESFTGRIEEVIPVPESLYSPHSIYRAKHDRSLGALPAKIIVIKTAIGEERLAGREIKNIYRINSKEAKSNGLIIGAMIDILLVWGFLSSMKQFK